MCNTCIHKIVCSKYIATGGVNNCEHHREDRKGRWIVKGQEVFCSHCDKESGYNHWGASAFSDYCPNCGVDMRGNENG